MLMRNFIANGLFIGFAATLITSIFMVLLRSQGKKILDLHLSFGRIFLGKRVKQGVASIFALMTHLIVGTALGLLYASVFAASIWTGLWYALMIWLLMNIALFPLFGKGLFGQKLDKKKVKVRAWLLTAVFHAIYGLVLGYFATM